MRIFMEAHAFQCFAIYGENMVYTVLTHIFRESKSVARLNIIFVMNNCVLLPDLFRIIKQMIVNFAICISVEAAADK